MLVGKNTRRRRKRAVPNVNTPIVVGKGKDMQFNPPVIKTWREDACDADNWKHGRVSDPYRDNYERIFGHN